MPLCTFSFFFLCGERRKHLSRLPTHTHRHFAHKKRNYFSHVFAAFFKLRKEDEYSRLIFPPRRKKGYSVGAEKKKKKRNTIRTHMGITAARELLRLYTHPFFPKNIYSYFFRVLDTDMGNQEQEILFFSPPLLKRKVYESVTGGGGGLFIFPRLNSSTLQSNAFQY